MHIGVEFHHYLEVPFSSDCRQVNSGTHIDLTCIINFAKFGIDRSQGWVQWAVKY